MNNKFKRALSSILAFVMVFASITVMNVSSAMAADTFAEVWPNKIADPNLKTLACNTTMGGNALKVAEITFSDGYVFTSGATTGDVITTFGFEKVARSSSIKTGIEFTPSVSGTIKIYAYADSGDAAGKPSLDPAVTASDGSTVTPAGKLLNNKMTSGDPITFDVTSGVTYSLKSAGGKGVCLIAAGVVAADLPAGQVAVTATGGDAYAGTFTVTPATIVTDAADTTALTVTYEGDDYTMPEKAITKADLTAVTDETGTVTGYTYDVSGLASTMTEKTYTVAVNGTGFAGTFTVNPTTVAYSGSFTLSYTGNDYSMTEQTLTGASPEVSCADGVMTVTPNKAWFQKNVTYASVVPTVSGNTKTYDFTDASVAGAQLASKTCGATIPEGAAYADFAGTDGNDLTCYITLDANGATLIDESATASPKLSIPGTKQTTGKATIVGSVTSASSNSGSKWKLVDFGVVSIANDASKNVALVTNSSDTAATNAGALVNGQKISYEVTLDFDTQTASGTITNGATTQTYTDVPFIAGAVFDDVSSICNNGGTGSSARKLVIDKVSITSDAPAPENPIVQTGSTATENAPVGVFKAAADKYYVVSVVAAANVNNPAYTILNQNSQAGTSLVTSDTVYNAVTFDGTTEYTAVDFGGAEGDYVFASVVEGVTDADVALVKAVTTTLTPAA